MLKQAPFFLIKNKKGMAIFEAIPIIIVIVLFVNFSLGFFGVIHTGILNSISARNYAFETFRHRANLVYFRNTPGAPKDFSYAQAKVRAHGTITESAAGSSQSDPDWIASSRTIDFFAFEKRAAEELGKTKSEHARTRSIASGRVSEGVHRGVNPVWIKTSYGICLDAICEQR
jgi:hypothetical protein